MQIEVKMPKNKSALFASSGSDSKKYRLKNLDFV